MNASYQPPGPCACGEKACKAEGTKLVRALRDDDGPQHLVGCNCVRHRNKRNNGRGKRGQAKMHKRLGGESWTPHHEESARPYTVEVVVMPESKAGAQIPKSWASFIATDWFRRALSQSARSAPLGSGVIPAIVLDGRWLVADLRPRKGERGV